MSISDTRQPLDRRDLWRCGRDVRTLRLHDPIGFRVRSVGEYLLQDKAPAPAPAPAPALLTRQSRGRCWQSRGRCYSTGQHLLKMTEEYS